jgi:hypothetical protein
MDAVHSREEVLKAADDALAQVNSEQKSRYERFRLMQVLVGEWRSG